MFQHSLCNNFLYSQYFELYKAVSWIPPRQNWLSICQGCLDWISPFDTWRDSLTAFFHSNSKIYESLILTIMLSCSFILHFFFSIKQVSKHFMKITLAMVWRWVRQKGGDSRKLNSQFMTLPYCLSLTRVFHQGRSI